MFDPFALSVLGTVRAMCLRRLGLLKVYAASAREEKSRRLPGTLYVVVDSNSIATP